MKLSEKSKQALFALLALVAIAAAAYVFIFAQNAEQRSPDPGEFYFALSSSPTVGFLFDVRGAQTIAQKSLIYQCGVNIISKGRLAGKTLKNIACDGSGCIAATTAANGSTKMGFSEAKKEMAGIPYILIMPGDGEPAFFPSHMEIYVPANITGNETCDISATES